MPTCSDCVPYCTFVHLSFFHAAGAQPFHEVPDDPNGGLHGFKKQMLEGGIRVPAIVEWPGVISPRITHYPVSAYDFFPTIAEIVSLPASSMLEPQDGLSIYKLFLGEIPSGRNKDILMSFRGVDVSIHNDLKLVRWAIQDRWASGVHSRRFYPNRTRCSTASAPIPLLSECSQAWTRLSAGYSNHTVALFNLSADPEERYDLWGADDLRLARTAVHMEKTMGTFVLSLKRSRAGLDYPEGRVMPQPPEDVWCKINAYRPYAHRILQHHQYRASASAVYRVNGSDTMCTFDRRALCADGSLPPPEESSSNSSKSSSATDVPNWSTGTGPLDPPPDHPLILNPHARLPFPRGGIAGFTTPIWAHNAWK